MTATPLLVFFYGSYINKTVLAEVGLDPDRFEVAKLPGYDITIGPLANLHEAEGKEVWGVVATATENELERLYEHAESVLGGLYLPRQVTIEIRDGTSEPALTYIAESLNDLPTNAAYVGKILEPARELGFPAEYIERLESFLPCERKGLQ